MKPPLRLGNGFTANSNPWDGSGSIWGSSSNPATFVDGAADLELRSGKRERCFLSPPCPLMLFQAPFPTLMEVLTTFEAELALALCCLPRSQTTGMVGRISLGVQQRMAHHPPYLGHKDKHSRQSTFATESTKQARPTHSRMAATHHLCSPLINIIISMPRTTPLKTPLGSRRAYLNRGT